MAVLAGVDIMCFANNVPGSQTRKVDLIFSAIKSAVAKGEITPQRIDESFKRIMKLKKESLNKTDYKALAKHIMSTPANTAILIDSSKPYCFEIASICISSENTTPR